MKLKLIHQEDMGDWYTIERAIHDNRHWIETKEEQDLKVHNCMYSGRICDADVEGTLQEMVDIAWAIKRRGEESHKRCSVKFIGDGFEFDSPRNSQQTGFASIEEADDLAEQILTEYKKVNQ